MSSARSRVIACALAVGTVLGATSALGAQATATVDPAPKTSGTPVEIGPAHLHPYYPRVDVSHYDLAFDLPARGASIRASAVLTVRRESTLDTLRLDLVGMRVDAVAVNGRTRAFRQDSSSVRVPLRAADGVVVRVSVRYAGAPRDGLIVREDSARGWSAFGDNWPNRARYWIPSVDHPSDKATVAWTVVGPAALTVVANGDRVSRRLLPGRAGTPRRAETRYRITQPIPTYLMVFGAATLREKSLGATACGAAPRAPGNTRGCVPQSVYTFPQEASFAPGPFAEADSIVAYFARTFAPFPYSRLAHLQSATRFGGMENATAIFYSDNAFRNRSLGVPLIAHETAHQWFGDAVTPRRWPDLWLSEGFASYLTPLYLRHSRGDSAFRAAMREIRETIISAPVVEQRPVVDSVGGETPMALLNANSYQKGAFVLHMLRAEVGDSAFFRALREYQRQYRHGTAITGELQRIVEKHHGASLQPFFAQWLHRPGWAELSLRWQHDAARGVVTVEVTQGTRFPPFAVPLTLVFRDASGREAVSRVSVPAAATTRLEVPVAGIGAPVSVGVDPDVLLLGRVLVEPARR